MNFVSASDFTFSEKSLFCEIQFLRCVRGFWRHILFSPLLTYCKSNEKFYSKLKYNLPNATPVEKNFLKKSLDFDSQEFKQTIKNVLFYQAVNAECFDFH